MLLVGWLQIRLVLLSEVITSGVDDDEDEGCEQYRSTVRSQSSQRSLENLIDLITSALIIKRLPVICTGRFRRSFAVNSIIFLWESLKSIARAIQLPNFTLISDSLSASGLFFEMGKPCIANTENLFSL